jgi:hypothetical protein
MLRRVLGTTRLFALLGIAIPAAMAADATTIALERRFDQTVLPFLKTYCAGCHGNSSPAAQFDIRPYTSLTAVLADFGHWDLLLGRLNAREMPPSVASQPSAAARQAVIDWIQAVRANEAKKNAGDPGPVLARRLSNAEYNYTIRDLTGVDLRPTREFPVDPANTAGFDNSGESLSMSPALLNKYLQAAREIANHMVLSPDSIDFAPHPMLVETDKDKYAIQRIIDFYNRQQTDYAAYFEAAWRYKHRAALGKPRATLASIASESQVSAKYLPMVWQVLEEPTEKGKPEVGPIAKLQGMWKSLPAPGPNAEEAVRAKSVEMRDYVKRMRYDTAMQFSSPLVRGLPTGHQPVQNWKYRQYNANRRKFDPKSLRAPGDPPPPPAPPTLRRPGLHQDAAQWWAAMVNKSRATNEELVVPPAERSRYEASFARLADVFPDNFYVSERGRYFPDDSEDKGRLLSAGYHNSMGYWRDDVPLSELLLDEKGQKELERLWLEFEYIAAHTERTWVQFWFNQSGAVDGRGAESGHPRPSERAIPAEESVLWMRDKYVTKAKADPNNDPVAPLAMETQFKWINDTLRLMERLHVEAEPKHLDALVRFAAKAYRRQLSQSERGDMLAYYKHLRENSSLSHEEAIRDSIVAILMSPKFLYRIDAGTTLSKVSAPPAGAPRKPLSTTALANRLSYFLWSSMPDEELLSRAAAGDLQKPEVLTAQVRRMLKDPRARGLATEFAGNWLDFRRFEEHNAVDRERFPGFDNELRQAMFEEPVRFIEDVIRTDRPVTELLYGNHTFVNPVLAKHYGMPEVAGKNDKWIRVDDANKYGRGGLLPMAVFLTQNAPGLRTSPVKRGYWVVRRVLGETIPPPPPQVPELPKDEGKMDLPLRDMLARHRENAACAGCHAKFDSFGLVFEGYGPVGEKRAKDLAGRPVETQATFPGGATGDGVAGVQAYIRQHRQKDFVDNLCRKLLAYSLGRSLLLSDEPVIERMKANLSTSGYRFGSMVEAIVASPQFLNKRSPELTAQKGK